MARYLTVVVLAAAWVAAPQSAVACSCDFTALDVFPPADASDVPRNVVVVLDVVDEYGDLSEPRLCRGDSVEVEAAVTVERSPKVLSAAHYWNSSTGSENVRYTIRPREPLLARRRHTVGFGSDCAEVVAGEYSYWPSSHFFTGNNVDTEAPPAVEVLSAWVGTSDNVGSSCGSESFEWIEVINAAAMAAQPDHGYFEVCARLDATEAADCWLSRAFDGRLTIGVVPCSRSWSKFGSTYCGDDQHPFEYTLTAYDAAGNRGPTSPWLPAGFDGSPMTSHLFRYDDYRQLCAPGVGEGCAAARDPAVGAVALAYGAFALLFALRRRRE